MLESDFNVEIPTWSKWQFPDGFNPEEHLENDGLDISSIQEASIIFELANIPDMTPYDSVDLACPGTSEATSATCLFTIEEQTVSIPLGETSTVALSPSAATPTIGIKLTCSQEPASFQYPVITFHRKSGKLTDMDGVESSLMPDHGKGLLYTIPIYPDYGEIEIETIHLTDPHEIPEFMFPLNEVLDGDINVACIPMICTSKCIIGINILEEHTLVPWKVVVEEDGTMYFSVRMKAHSLVNLAYIVIDISTMSYSDALEIWHRSFPSSYDRYQQQSGAWRTENSPHQCSFDFNERFSWGKSDSLKSFQPYDMLHATIPVAPSQLEACAGSDSHENKNMCGMILDSGMVDSSGNYIVSGEYTYSIRWSSLVAKQFPKATEYSGLAITVFDTREVSYRVHSEDTLSIFNDNNDEMIPQLMSALPFARAHAKEFPSGCISLVDWIHPQLIHYTASVGLSIKNIKNMLSSSPDEIRRKLWTMRYALGSRPMTIVEEGDPADMADNVEDYFSFALVSGAYPSWKSSSNDWSECALLVQYKISLNEWKNVFNEVTNYTLYHSNVNNSVQVTLLDGPDTSFVDYSMFCQKKEDVDSPACYVNVMLGNKQEKSGSQVVVHVDFADENDPPTCHFVPSDLSCKVNGFQVVLTMDASAVRYRTTTLKFVKVKKLNALEWVQENMWWLILFCIPVICLLVGMGYAVYVMFCRKRSDHEHLARMIEHEKKQQQRKAQQILDIEYDAKGSDTVSDFETSYTTSSS